MEKAPGIENKRERVASTFFMKIWNEKGDLGVTVHIYDFANAH